MGFDLDRFVGLVDEGLICSICSEVLERPLMVDSCEHAYCDQCIRQWFQVQQHCPQCRINFVERQLVLIPRYMRNQLNGLKIRCNYADEGCEQVVRLECVDLHENQCIYNEINTRITKRVDNEETIELSYLHRKEHRYRYQYEVIKWSMTEESKLNAIKLAKEALYLFGRVNYGEIAAYMKTHLEPEHNKYWHCVAGTDFDCFLSANSLYISLRIDGIYIIAFKTR